MAHNAAARAAGPAASACSDVTGCMTYISRTALERCQMVILSPALVTNYLKDAANILLDEYFLL